MRFSAKKIAVSAVFLFSVNLASLVAVEPELKLNSMQDYCFQLINGYANGDNPDFAVDSSLYELSKNSCKLLLSPVFTKDGLVSVIEMVSPEKTSLIDSSYNYRDCIEQKEENRPDWIESIVYALAKEGSDFEYDIDPGVLENLDGRDQKGLDDSDLQEKNTESTLATTEGALRHYNFGVENLTQSKNQNNIILTDEAEGFVRRRTFSQDYQLLKYEEFMAGDKAKEITLELKRDYFYDDEENLVQTVEEKTLDKAKTILDYNSQNKVTRKRTGHFIDDKFYDDSDITFEYDENGNETVISGQNWYWQKDRFKRLQSKKTTFKKVWDYSKFSDKPDYEYFENNEIRMRTVYVSEKVYNETMYFDDGYSVETTYEDGFKTLERILIRGRVKRRTVFEKQ